MNLDININQRSICGVGVHKAGVSLHLLGFMLAAERTPDAAMDAWATGRRPSEHLHYQARVSRWWLELFLPTRLKHLAL